MTPGRILTASILAEVESGRRLDVAWEDSGAAASPERAWIRTLAYGTLRLRGRIDYLLSRFSNRRLRELDPSVRTALRMGAFQLTEMGSVPDYAAVSESVRLVRATGGRAAAGLVNAVLRKLAQAPAGPDVFPDPETDLEGYLTTWGSHPSWLVRRWVRAFGSRGARALVEVNNREPEIFLWPIGNARDAATVLAAAGLSASAPGSCARGDRWIRLRSGTDPAAALELVPGTIQDPAASLVVRYCAPEPGSLLADLCAAPGGKALALSETAGGVVASDLSQRRLARVAEGWGRMTAHGLQRARLWPVVADARFPPIRKAHTVLVDSPCSGTGTLRRHPDGRWRMTPDTIRTLVQVQSALLNGAASVVPCGGLLVYATCTLEPEENWCQVERFLARHPGFRVEPGTGAKPCQDERGCLAVLPHESGFDGAFAARLRRVG